MSTTETPAERDARLLQRIGYLEAELRKYTGALTKPQPGTHHCKLVFGDAYVIVEYEYSHAEEPVYDLNSPMCGPGHGAEVVLLNVLINGAWCDVEDVVPEATQDRWIEQIIEDTEE